MGDSPFSVLYRFCAGSENGMQYSRDYAIIGTEKLKDRKICI